MNTPFNLVILGSRMCQNSLHACTAVVAETSVAMVVASCAPEWNGIWLTSKVWFGCGNQWGVDDWGCGAGWDEVLELRSGLDPCSNLTCFWNEKAWSWLLYCAAPWYWLTIPRMRLKNVCWDTPTYGRFEAPWLASDTSRAWIFFLQFLDL